MLGNLNDYIFDFTVIDSAVLLTKIFHSIVISIYEGAQLTLYLNLLIPNSNINFINLGILV